MSNGIILKEFNISGNLLTVSAAACEGNPNFRIVFSSGDMERILPLLPEEKGGYSYTYLLDVIFTEMPSEGEIKVSFQELIEGDYRDVSVSVSDDFNTNLKKVSIYGRKLLKFSKYVYKTDVKENNFTIICSKNKNYLLKSFVIFCRILFGILAFLMSLFVFGLSCIKELKNLKGGIGAFLRSVKTDVAVFLRWLYNDEDVTARILFFFEKGNKKYYKKACNNPIVPNRITFVSGRRDELSGNEKFVYDVLKDNKELDIKILTSSNLSRKSTEAEKQKFFDLYATSRVVIVDDHFTLIDTVDKREGVNLIQLWHACGAFKTFGFTRLGKPGGPLQTAPTHRMYDYAVVSSKKVARNYAEGFGVSPKNILPFGVPRTDVFFDESYKEKIRERFYSEYPTLKGKKIVLFAPTFRGNGKDSAYYETERFDPVKFVEEAGEDYALIIKLHPFCKEKYTIDDKYQNRIIDLSDKDELNDLLFATDLLITDYSSCVFEASLLDIPMLFYVYDLDEYTADRDFYCDFRSFVPGHISPSFEDVIASVKAQSFEQEKVKPFRDKYFDNPKGNASSLVAEKILEIINN